MREHGTRQQPCQQELYVINSTDTLLDDELGLTCSSAYLLRGSPLHKDAKARLSVGGRPSSGWSVKEPSQGASRTSW
eukprot:1071556-Amphidinium_carterae.1